MLYSGSNPAPFITTKNGLPLESSKKREVESVYKNIYLKWIFFSSYDFISSPRNMQKLHYFIIQHFHCKLNTYKNESCYGY